MTDLRSEQPTLAHQVRAAQADPDAFRIFISYRREDAGHAAGRLYDVLSQRFEAEHLFRDVDTIEPGDDFVNALTDAVALCDVLIAVIGRRWLTQRRGGARRIDDPNDWMRIELEAALTRGIKLVPALTDGATMPKPSALPETLQQIVRKQAITLPQDNFHPSATRLRESLEKAARKKRETAELAARQSAEAEAAERERLARVVAEREANERRAREAEARAQVKREQAEREALAHVIAEREASERKAREAEARAQMQREQAERRALARHIARIDGAVWEELSRAQKNRYSSIIDAINESNLTASELAARDGKQWILLNAGDRFNYEAIVRAAVKRRT